MNIAPLSLAAFAALLAAPVTAHAAESFDACTATITVLPVTLDSGGRYCLRNDVSTPISSGTAIEVNANNVTLDCNGFKIGNLGAGTGTSTTGVWSARTNTTVRNCNIRGFRAAIALEGGSGHVVEDNRIDASRFFGIAVTGSSVVRRNRIVDTGGSTSGSFSDAQAYGILFSGSVEIEDNLIDGFVPPPGGSHFEPAGISGEDEGFSRIAGNTIRNLVVIDENVDYATGIETGGAGTLVAGNVIGGAGAELGQGVSCFETGVTVVRDNAVSLFPVAIDTDCIFLHNDMLP